MNAEQKLDALKAYRKGARAFNDVLRMDKKLLDFRPTPDAWTIREQVVHFLDSDVNSVARCRRAVAEPFTPVVGYDEEAWTQRLDYGREDVKLVVDLDKSLRDFVFRFLKRQVAADWTKWGYKHSERGDENLEKWLAVYIDHVRFHRELIDRNIRLFKARAKEAAANKSPTGKKAAAGR